jgi:hypothetical protein
MQNTQKSEVARLKAEIELNSAAARYAMHGSTLGTAKHPFITRRMECMGEAHNKLAERIGDKRADKILIQAMEGRY